MAEFPHNELAPLAEEIRQSGLGPYDDTVLRPIRYKIDADFAEAYQEAVSIWGRALGQNASNRKTVRCMERLKKHGLVDGVTINMISVLALQDAQDVLHPERLLGSKDSCEILGFPACEEYGFERNESKHRLFRIAKKLGNGLCNLMCGTTPEGAYELWHGQPPK